MPKTAVKVSNVPDKAKKKQQERASGIPLIQWRLLVVSVISGAILGLSAPGFNQWYLAWIGLAPLFLLCASANNVGSAVLRSFLFACGYNLVYLNWYLGLHPLNWLGYSDWQSILITTAAWLIASIHQALITTIFCLVFRVLPFTGSFLPGKIEGKWRLPALLIVPVAWAIYHEKLANAPKYLGVPWPMLEYSQYHEIPMIQIASVIGGIGVQVLIVLANLSLACLIATLTKKAVLKSLSAHQISMTLLNVTFTALILTACLTFGYARLGTFSPQENLTASVVQGNINIEMQRSGKAGNVTEELLAHYDHLIQKVPPGLCVLTENALPVCLQQSPAVLQHLRQLATHKKIDIILGAVDKVEGNPFNAAFGISKEGTLLADVYHKRYLVPVGEYTPEFVNYLPKILKQLTNTPAGTGFSTGHKPTVLSFLDQTIAPLICFETLLPELTVTSVRNGGQIIVALSDLSWFHHSMAGDQTTAQCVFRAIECQRYFIYAANTGPSSIINSFGQIIKQSNPQCPAVLTAKISKFSNLTPFTYWYY